MVAISFGILVIQPGCCGTVAYRLPVARHFLPWSQVRPDVAGLHRGQHQAAMAAKAIEPTTLIALHAVS
jgi:hypothetical protein